MSLRRETPCDFGPCPYNAEQHGQCEYWCGDPRPEDEMGLWEEDFDEDKDWEEHSGYSYSQNNPPIPIGPIAVWEEYDEALADANEVLGWDE